MPVIYLKHDSYPALTVAESIDYYIELIAREMKICMNSNGISYAEKNVPDTNNDESATVILSSIGDESPLPYRQNGAYVFFEAGDPNSKRLAETIYNHLKSIFDEGNGITLMPEQIEGSYQSEPPPRAGISLGFFDSQEDLENLKNNYEKIIAHTVMAIAEYFGLPFAGCGRQKPTCAIAKTDIGVLVRPSENANTIKSIPAYSKVKIWGQWENWYIVGENGELGYVPTNLIDI